MLTKPEASAQLGIHETAFVSWVRRSLVTRYANNDYA
jgi:hypothetical protein